MLTSADKVLIVGILLAIGISTWWIFTGPKGELVEIQTPDEVMSVNLSSTPQIIFAHGVLGTTTIEIRKKKVRVVNSPCRQKICVKMGWKDKNDETIVCVPNKVLVKIVSSRVSKHNVDAITQ